MAPETLSGIMPARQFSERAREPTYPSRRRILPMPFQASYLFSAAMDVPPEKEALFNEVYDEEHVPTLLAVPGIVSVARFKTQKEVTLVVGGQRRTVVVPEVSKDARHIIVNPETRSITRKFW
jgi:hypothetical protein